VDIKSLQTALINHLANDKNIIAGISAAPVSGLIIRLLGNGAEQLYNCLQSIHSILQLNAAKELQNKS
jgi:urease accessory protein UreH